MISVRSYQDCVFSSVRSVGFGLAVQNITVVCFMWLRILMIMCTGYITHPIDYSGWLGSIFPRIMHKNERKRADVTIRKFMR
jgi:hypothetical protein